MSDSHASIARGEIRSAGPWLIVTGPAERKQLTERGEDTHAVRVEVGLGGCQKLEVTETTQNDTNVTENAREVLFSNT